MDTIKLQQVLPAVFAETPPPGSEVWLRDVVFEKGKSYLLEAASGTGKTSLFAYLYGYRTDYSGSIELGGKEASAMSAGQWSELRRTQVAMLFQDLRLFPELTVAENLALKNDITGHKDETAVVSLVERLGIGDKYDKPAAKLSFGQQQRVAFIRALCQPFDFILLDEPVSHLDDANSSVMASILAEECSRKGAGIIVTSIGKHFDIGYDKTLVL